MTLTARVVPAVPAFEVEEGFWYSTPAHLAERIRVGSRVRVPLGSGHTHGYVVELGEGSPRKLKPVSSVSGDLPLFDASLLSVCRWAARYYVSPLSIMLARTAPPNAPRAPAGAEGPSPLPGGGHTEGPAARLGEDAASGRRRRPGCVLMNPARGDWAGPLLGPVLAAGRSAVIVVPTALEEERMTGVLDEMYPGRVTGASSRHTDREKTAAWARTATRGGAALVATPGAALWAAAAPGLWVVVEDGRRAHKSRQTPTVGSLRVLRERSIREGGVLVGVGAFPSVDLLALGPDLYRRRGRPRLWAHVEVVDRRDPGRSGLFHPLTLSALGVAASAGGAFVFAHRRGYAPAMRCAACRTLRRCPRCGGRAARGADCPRCGAELGACRECGQEHFEPLGAGVERVRAELRRRFGKGWVGTVGEEAPITVGTEAALAGAGAFDLAVVVDADGLLYAPHYRAAEDALRVMVRLAGKLADGPGRRLLVQTSSPDHRVLSALRKGDGIAFLQAELDRRIETGFPPQGQLLALEARGAGVEEAADRLGAEARRLEGRDASVHGPASFPSGLRWLVEGGDLWEVKQRMRPLAARWRQRGLVVRVDVDPVDL